MAAVFEQEPPTAAEQLQLLAVEQMLRALCEQVYRLIDVARSNRRLDSREASLQLQAFEERRFKALEFLDSDRYEPCSTRIGNLEKLVEALDCSRAYFNGPSDEEDCTDTSQTWSVRVR
jgi:hypothetical protein